MEEKRNTKLSLAMFEGVNRFTGIDRNNLVVNGDTDIYVPHVIRQLWFRSVNPKGKIKTQMLCTMEDVAKQKYCLFVAEVFDGEENLLAMGHGSASVEEDSFFEAAERRAVGKALANAGFTWHNGDFSNDNDIAKSQMSVYNKYIEAGSLDITDQTVKMLYDDALVSVVPDGYGAATGKPIASMDQTQLANIAKNYGIINDGDPLVNAKIKFVYMYQLIEGEAAKQPEPENIEPDNTAENLSAENKEEKQKKRTGRKKKETVPDTDLTPEPETAPEPEPQQEQEHGTADNSVEPPAFEHEEQDNNENAVVNDTSAFSYGFSISDDDEETPFDDKQEGFFTDDDDAYDLGDEFFGAEIEEELRKEEALSEWGYSSEEELCADWRAHLKKVREKCKQIDKSDAQALQKFIEEIPIYDNFLWPDKSKDDKVVLLGDFLNKYKDEVIQTLNDGKFPIPTLREPVKWYADYVWDNF